MSSKSSYAFEKKYTLLFFIAALASCSMEYYLHKEKSALPYILITLEVMVLFVLFYFLFFKKWIKSISNACHTLYHNSDKTIEYTNKLKDISDELAKDTQQQANAIVDTLASVDEISAMINQTAGNSNTALNDAESTHNESLEGMNVVQDLQSSMTEIESSNKELEGLSTIIEEINQKTKVINDIVFETRLLSFNASIEAARAGQHGKGFAVVAEEVGNLANMSGNAAKEISSLLQQSVEQVNSTVTQITSKVENGIEVSNQCAGAFNSITGRIEGLIPLIKSIATAATEQELGVKQIQKAMRDIDATTNQNTKSSKESKEISDFLKDYFNEHLETVEKLNELISEGQNNIEIEQNTKEVKVRKANNSAQTKQENTARDRRKEVKKVERPERKRPAQKKEEKSTDNAKNEEKAEKSSPSILGRLFGSSSKDEKKSKSKTNKSDERKAKQDKTKSEERKQKDKAKNKEDAKETTKKEEVKVEKKVEKIEIKDKITVPESDDESDHALQGFPSADDPRFKD